MKHFGVISFFAMAGLAGVLAACTGGGTDATSHAKAAFGSTRSVASLGSLGSYNIDKTKTTVAGISSGGFMAVQLQVAYSTTFHFAAVYAGGVTRVRVERQPGPVGGVLPPAESIRVIVEDRGPGVPESERAHLFERFYRGGRAGQRASGHGTGLGLSLVAEHIRLHGGRVWSEDGQGGGTRFVVELPLQPDELGPDPLGGASYLRARSGPPPLRYREPG